MKRMKLTTAGRVVIFVIVLALLTGIGGFGYNYYKNNIADDKPISSGAQSGSTSQKPTTKPSAGKTDTSDPVINLSLDEWVGWKPIIDANDDASETGEALFAGQLDVAATWQPYLSYATENGDAHIMFSTTASKSLIMDGIVFRSDFAQAHPDVVTAFIDGIFQANAMYTTEFNYIRSVMPMFAGVSDEEIKAQCGDAEMMSYAENKEVLDSTAPSVYFDMCDIWESLGETVNRKVAMTLFDNQYLLPLASKYSSTSTSTSKPVELTEEQKQEIVNYEALLTKSMTVEFVADTAQFKNPEEAYAIMDEFVSIANTLDGAIIQVEGNINARNYSDSGQALSAERAKAVAKYFIACGIDPNRLITVGNGNTKMVADPGSADAYLNRRTDVFFKIIEE